jgi:hypothetical protein
MRAGHGSRPKRRKLTDERRQVDLAAIRFQVTEHRGLEVYLSIVRAASGT